MKYILMLMISLTTMVHGDSIELYLSKAIADNDVKIDENKLNELYDKQNHDSSKQLALAGYLLGIRGENEKSIQFLLKAIEVEPTAYSASLLSSTVISEILKLSGNPKVEAAEKRENYKEIIERNYPNLLEIKDKRGADWYAIYCSQVLMKDHKGMAKTLDNIGIDEMSKEDLSRYLKITAILGYQ